MNDKHFLVNRFSPPQIMHHVRISQINFLLVCWLSQTLCMIMALRQSRQRWWSLWSTCKRHAEKKPTPAPVSPPPPEPSIPSTTARSVSVNIVSTHYIKFPLSQFLLFMTCFSLTLLLFFGISSLIASRLVFQPDLICPCQSVQLDYTV